MTSDVEEVLFPSDDLQLYGRLRTHTETAPTIVLLCGVGFHTFEYEPLAEWLAARGLNCLSFDYRGHGRSGGPRGTWSLEELASDARHAIDLVQQRQNGPIAVFGNSLGGMVGITVGAEDRRVSHVVAANCPARIADFLLTTPRRMLFALAKLVAPFAPLRFSVDHFYAYEQLIADPSWISTIRNDELIRDARRLSVATYRSLLDQWDGIVAVQRLHTPLLIVQGRLDQLQPAQQSERLVDAANDPKEYLLVDTGHLPHVEDPTTLGGHLFEWLDRTA
jgi:alpha-beta hydrolase superfamily lysophospholipase